MYYNLYTWLIEVYYWNIYLHIAQNPRGCSADSIMVYYGTWYQRFCRWSMCQVSLLILGPSKEFTNSLLGVMFDNLGLCSRVQANSTNLRVKSFMTKNQCFQFSSLHIKNIKLSRFCFHHNIKSTILLASSKMAKINADEYFLAHSVGPVGTKPSHLLKHDLFSFQFSVTYLDGNTEKREQQVSAGQTQ